MDRLSLRLFGYPRIFLNDQPVKLERRKTLALAAYLGAEGGPHGCSREQIAALFWPDCSQEQASAYLRQALWDFARAAGDGWILRTEHTLSFVSTPNLWVDFSAFTAQLAAWKAGHLDADGLEQLVALCQGDFLAGFSLRDCPAFDDWQVFKGEAFRLQLAQALEGLVKAHAAGQNFDRAIESAHRWLSLDPLNEDAHLALMRLFISQGQPASALRQYENLSQRLADELGLEPGPETTAVYRQIQEGGAQPAAQRRKEPTLRLPAQMTTFLGREEELARLSALLADADCRLISLVGIGGSGKSRLSIQAAGMCHGYSDGIYFISLAGAETLEQMILAIGESLQAPFQNAPGSNLKLEAAQEQLLNYLTGKQVLLILDNFEQLLGHALTLHTMLDSAPGLKLLVTSRESLNLREETVVEVGGLAFPTGADFTSATEYPAVQLFLKSASRTGRFQPQARDWEAIVRICRLVDGIPLGIEMAAAWTRALTCVEIADEIARDLDFLQATWRGLPERQATFRAIFEHSWRLLADKERDMLQRLSIFHSSFNRAEALAVAGASLEGLSSLIDRCMLRRLSSGRFDIHPVLRPYAAEKAAAAPAILAETRRCFAIYYSDYLQEQFERLKGAQQLSALTGLRGEIQNISAAWKILIELRDTQRLRSGLPGAILYNVMNDRRIEMAEFGQLVLEMIAWLDSEQSQVAHEEPPCETTVNLELLALALAAYRHLTIDFIHLDQTASHRRQSLEIAARLPDSPCKAYTLLLDSIGPGTKDFLRESQATCQESLEIFERLDDTWGSALALMVQADDLTFNAKEFADAAVKYRISLKKFSQLGSAWGQALCLNGLANTTRQTGALQDAFQLGQQSLELLEKLDNQERTLQIRLFLAEIAEELNDLENAFHYHTLNRTHSLRRGNEQIARYFQERLALLEKRKAGGPALPTVS